MRIEDCYAILEVQPDATLEEVKSAYRDISLVWHPDRFPNSPRLQAKANEKMKEINAAYDQLQMVLSQPTARPSQSTNHDKQTPPSTQHQPKPAPNSTKQAPSEPRYAKQHQPEKSATASRRNPKDGAEIVFIPAGEFLMGNKNRKVTLNGYYIYKNLVTVAQYKQFCQATNRKMPPALSFDQNWERGDHPIVNVSWNDAKAYCDWAGVRLPTEQEWEKAARGTDGRNFPWGNDWDANKCAISDRPYGLSDMAGNLWQWCADDYDGTGQYRLLRGGSWGGTVGGDFWSTDRNWCAPDVRWGVKGGFRCVAHADSY